MFNSFVTPWTATYQAPLSMGFPRQEYWSGLPLPSSGDLPDPGIEPTSPALAGGFFALEPPGKPLLLRQVPTLKNHLQYRDCFNFLLWKISNIHRSERSSVINPHESIDYHQELSTPGQCHLIFIILLSSFPFFNTEGPCRLLILNRAGCVCQSNDRFNSHNSSLSPVSIEGCPGGSDGKESACQCRRRGLDPWVRKIPRRRKWQPTPVFLPGKSHGQRSLEGYSP